MTRSKKVLISGGGVAGPTLALLLARNGHVATVIERSRSLRATGQQIDVSTLGMQITKRMGLLEKFKTFSVGDKGLRVVDPENTVVAEFPQTGSGRYDLVREIEILRGDMVNVLYQETTDSVKYEFGQIITGLREHESGITVSFSSGPDRDFDIVIAADGLFSRTRELVFGKSHGTVHSLKQSVSVFTVPWQESDGHWTRFCNFPGGRTITLRPQPRNGKTGAYLCVMTPESGELARKSMNDQKAACHQSFMGLGWEASRLLTELDKSEDFYNFDVAQVYVPQIRKGRIALLGDAGYCASPVSGQGTELCFVGAYVLAGCICTYDDCSEALNKYEEQMRPFVTYSQKLLPGVPGIANPRTTLGIWVLRNVLWMASVVTNSWLTGLISNVLEPIIMLLGGRGLVLPEFPEMRLNATRDDGLK